MTYPDTYNGLHMHLDERVRASADVAVPLLQKLLPLQSVVDVGCGSGIWLDAFQRAGVGDYLGLDGDYIVRATLQIPLERFQAADFTKSFSPGRNFDLAICLEVAEHIPPNVADAFIESLSRAAPVVFFSAAIPGQGGMGHVNEQWPSYWKGKFETQGYVAFDTLRRWLWPRDDVFYWYAQNSLLYVRESEIGRYPLLNNEPRDFIVDVLHPHRYLTLDRTARAGESPSLAFLMKSAPSAAARFVKSRLGIPLNLREPSHK